jgi:hypothetical protein
VCAWPINNLCRSGVKENIQSDGPRLLHLTLWTWGTIDLGSVICILLFTNLPVFAVVVVKPSDVCRGISENQFGLS